MKEVKETGTRGSIMERRVRDLVLKLNPVGQGRILHHLRCGRYDRAAAVCREALDRALRAWKTSRAASAPENYLGLLNLWTMIGQLEAEGAV